MKALKYLAAIATLAAVGCVHQTEPPPLSGPSDFALSMTVTSSPQAITQNGFDTSVITATLRYTNPANGQTGPKANVPVRLDMGVDGVAVDYGTLSCRSGVTGSDGVVMCGGNKPTYTAPPMPAGGLTGNGCNGVPGQCVQVSATTTDTTAANNSIASAATTIALVPQGVILPPAGSPTPLFTVTPTPITVGSAVTFDGSASTPGNGASSITTYSWTFGDGSSGTGKTVSHTYNTAGTFQATLTVTNDRGLSATTPPQSIPVGSPTAPTAAFVFSPTQPVVNQIVFFNASTSTSANGHNITQFNWNFGDGTSGNGLTTSHAYAAQGVYVVTLSILDDTGQRATASGTVTVGGPNPIAVLNVTKAGAFTVNADGSASTAKGTATIVSYRFIWGDGTADTVGASFNVSHPFAGPVPPATSVTYTVTLIVTDSNGLTGSATKDIQLP